VNPKTFVLCFTGLNGSGQHTRSRGSNNQRENQAMARGGKREGAVANVRWSIPETLKQTEHDEAGPAGDSDLVRDREECRAIVLIADAYFKALKANGIKLRAGTGSPWSTQSYR
jgi:hypothetical protein